MIVKDPSLNAQPVGLSLAHENKMDITFVSELVTIFHGYTVHRCGCVFGQTGKQMRAQLRPRRGGKFDLRLGLSYQGKRTFWHVQRLVALCFKSTTGFEMYSMEANHDDRNTFNNHGDNLEWATPSENQKHWREDEEIKKLSGTSGAPCSA